MNRYELIQQLENNPNFYELFKHGLLDLSILNRKCYYEKYLQELTCNKKSQAITNAAEEYKVSDSTIYKTIKFMEE